VGAWRVAGAWHRFSVTLILDSGGLSALAGNRARLVELRRRGWWPAQVPAIVLAEALTGDHRRDFHVNRLLRACQIREVTEVHARGGAQLRTATGRAGTISATDAVVAAMAISSHEPVVVTSDPKDIEALVEHSSAEVAVLPV
jgi:predicted nucleic acid-binding protein